MGKILPCLITLFLFMLQATAVFAEGHTVTVRVKGVINAGVSQYLSRAVKEATEQNAALLLVTLDTPGGLLNFTREILGTFGQSEVPVVVYVSPAGASATSAGALIAQGAHVIAMAPGTNMGAAHPVGGQGEDVKGAMGEKVVNDTVAMARSMATLRGRNAQWIEDAIRKSVSVPAEEAVKAGAAEVVVANESELLVALEGRKVKTKSKVLILRGLEKLERQEISMTRGEKLLQFLGDPNVLYLLMAIGGLGLYAELSAPGIGVAGIVSVISFILAFVSTQTLPVSTGALILLVLGVVLLIAEVFITSYGILGVGGIVSMVLGALFLMDPSTGDLRVSTALIVWVTILLGSLAAALGYFVVKTRKSQYKGLDHMAGVEAEIETVNDDGCTGKCFAWGETWDFVCQDYQDYQDHQNTSQDAVRSELKRGDRVEILRRDGLKLVVKTKSVSLNRL